MNEVMEHEKQITEVDYKNKAIEWLQSMGTNLPPAQTAQFLELCQAYKLNPFKREIYAVGYNGKFNIITGYEVYLKRAERTGKLNGWKCITNENDTKAKITIYRKDWQYPFEHEVLMQEVKQNSPIWQKMPVFMMKKVCIEQGMRLCFPDDLGGMPYAEEEVSYDTVIKSEDDEKPIDIKPIIEERNWHEKLEKLERDFEIPLKETKQEPTPYDQIQEVLRNGTMDEWEKMYHRTCAYLDKKGVKVV